MDLPGIATMAPAIICLLLALQWGGTLYAWNSGRIIALLVVSSALFVAFVAVQTYSGDRAMVPPRIFLNRNILGAVIFGSFMGAAFASLNYYVSLFNTDIA